MSLSCPTVTSSDSELLNEALSISESPPAKKLKSMWSEIYIHTFACLLTGKSTNKPPSKASLWESAAYSDGKYVQFHLIAD